MKAGAYFGVRNHYVEIEETWWILLIKELFPWAIITGKKCVKFNVILMGGGLSFTEHVLCARCYAMHSFPIIDL